MDNFTRLFKEAQMTLDTAQYLHNNGIDVSVCEFDFNAEKATRSTSMVSTALGYAAALDFKGITKPEELFAVKAADAFCRA